jgi:hypothetical protein
MLVPRVLLILVLLVCSGCTHWRQVRPLSRPAQDTVFLRAARLTTGGMEEGRMRAARLFLLRDVQVTADSVVGWADGVGQRVAVHRNQVSALESRRIDPWGTAGATLIVLTVAYGALLWYALSQGDW